jgi:hypothetical protein
MKVIRGVGLTQLSHVSFDSATCTILVIFPVKIHNILLRSARLMCKFYLDTKAWSISLNPKGGTYASTGGSGNVTIHSAEVDNFGELLTTLPSGRNKFGIHCKHVRSYSLFCRLAMCSATLSRTLRSASR